MQHENMVVMTPATPAKTADILRIIAPHLGFDLRGKILNKMKPKNIALTAADHGEGRGLTVTLWRGRKTVSMRLSEAQVASLQSVLRNHRHDRNGVASIPLTPLRAANPLSDDHHGLLVGEHPVGDDKNSPGSTGNTDFGLDIRGQHNAQNAYPESAQ